jgi:hypothetical protein
MPDADRFFVGRKAENLRIGRFCVDKGMEMTIPAIGDR